MAIIDQALSSLRRSKHLLYIINTTPSGYVNALVSLLMCTICWPTSQVPKSKLVQEAA
jgi:hypothetical protein